MKVFKPLRHCVTPPLYFALQNTEEEFKCTAFPVAKDTGVSPPRLRHSPFIPFSENTA